MLNVFEALLVYLVLSGEFFLVQEVGRCLLVLRKTIPRIRGFFFFFVYFSSSFSDVCAMYMYSDLWLTRIHGCI